MSTVTTFAVDSSVLTPSRVAMPNVGPATRPASRRCGAKTRIPLPHISESDPSAFL